MTTCAAIEGYDQCVRPDGHGGPHETAAGRVFWTATRWAFCGDSGPGGDVVCVMPPGHVGPHDDARSHQWPTPRCAAVVTGDPGEPADYVVVKARCVMPAGHDEQHASAGGYRWSDAPDGPDTLEALAGASSVAAKLSALLANLGTALEPVIEATNGYRAKVLAEGYPEDVAARMAADYHHYLTRMLTESMVATSSEGR